MTQQPTTIVLIHGFGGKRLWMAPLAHRLNRNYDVLNWSYFSYGGSIERHGTKLAKFLDNLGSEGNVNIVAHSMGSIVTRVALQKTTSTVNRVVMLAPPNCGSNVARIAAPILGSISTPIRQLSSCNNSFVNSLTDDPTCEIGVIASQYDVLVPVKNTIMKNLTDHQVILGTHNSLLFSSRVAKMTDVFIRTGKFAA